ncbi:MAG TPA: potassium channel family protein [Aquabacterium sp.]|nr:potassium channel family protein [Aquabacterium sp.]
MNRLSLDTWRMWAMLTALVVSIPAFYDSLMPVPSAWIVSLYGLSGVLILGSTLGRAPVSTSSRPFWTHPQHADRVLGAAMLISAVIPHSNNSVGALSWRLSVELATLIRLLALSQPFWAGTGLLRLVAMSAGLLGLCGVGFYWIDPQITTVEDGMWLAFTTAATVGFGDVVPNTTASRIFSVFVVLLGYGVLSLVTASIAAMFVGNQERKVEQEILRDMHTQLRAVRREIADLRAQLDEHRAAQEKAGSVENRPAS